MRISKSLAKLAPGGPPPRSEVIPQDQRPQRRSSFDNLVIPHRIRFPSNMISQIKPIDLAVTRNLLDAAAQAPETMTAAPVDPAPSEPRDSFDSSFTDSDQQQQWTRPGSPGGFYIRHHSRTASWAAGQSLCSDANGDRQYRNSSSSSMEWKYQQHELGNSYDGPFDFAARDADQIPYMEFAAQAGDVDVLRIEAAEAAKKYNALAKVHGLARFGVTQDHGQYPSLKSRFVLSDWFQSEPDSSDACRVESNPA